MARAGTLYVFLHGLWVVSEGPNNNIPADKIEIVLPEVPGHVYKAGSWLIETEIESTAPLELIGVTPGNGTFVEPPPRSSLIVSLTGCSLTPFGRAATLIMPRPATPILQLLHARDPRGGYVVKRTDTGETWLRVATVQVLTYPYADENEVALKGHYWEPCTTGGAMSLHIISTQEGPISLAHEIDTTRALQQVINGYPGLDFAQPIFPAAWQDNNNPTDFGDLRPLAAQGDQFIVTNSGEFAFSQAELEYTSARTARLGRLGRLKQQGSPISGLWHEGDPLDDRMSNCQGILVW